MRRITIAAGMLLLVALATACRPRGPADSAVSGIAPSMPTIYETTFAMGPSWIDDDVEYHSHFPPFEDDHLWQQDRQNYFIRARNHIGNPPPLPYHPNRYSVVPVTLNGRSFRLIWQQKMLKTEWSAGVNFGLFDEDIWGAGGPEGKAGNAVYVDFGAEDRGNVIGLYVHAAGKIDRRLAIAAYADNTWYTCTLVYDAGKRSVALTVFERDTDKVVASLSLPVAAKFTKPLCRLGTSRSAFGWSGYTGVSATAVAEGLIDTVRLEGGH